MYTVVFQHVGGGDYSEEFQRAGFPTLAQAEAFSDGLTYGDEPAYEVIETEIDLPAVTPPVTPDVITITTTQETAMPSEDQFLRRVNLSTLAIAVNAIRGEAYDVVDVLQTVTEYAILSEGECQRCGVDRPLLEIDGEPVCLVCKTTVSREYAVTLSITYQTRVTVRAVSEEDAEEKAREMWDNGDVDTDSETPDVEIDRVELAW
jgi:uncharacterized Zn finger protein (UPF0148 family)